MRYNYKMVAIICSGIHTSVTVVKMSTFRTARNTVYSADLSLYYLKEAVSNYIKAYNVIRGGYQINSDKIIIIINIKTS